MAEALIVWIIIGIAIALIARSKGRSGIGWSIYAFVVWPIALVHILVLSRTSESEMKRASAQGRRPCPHCAEYIKQEARVCPYCRKEVGGGNTRSSPERLHRGVLGYPGARD